MTAFNFPDPRREQFLERPLPANEDAEKAILGGILLDNKLAHEVFSALTPEDFYSPLHRRIATAMRDLNATAKKIDPILIGEELKKDGSIEAIGGVTTITNLTYGLPHFTTLEEYITLVRVKSLARQTVRLFSEATSGLLEEEEAPGDIMARTAKALVDMASGGQRTESLKEVAGHVRKIFDEWSAGNTELSSVPTGIPELDAKLRLNGLAYGELTLVGARPSTGKTGLLIQFATNAIKLGIPTLFISLEMLKERIVMRMLPATTGIPNKAINPTTLRNMPAERDKLYAALDQLDYPMYFDRSFTLPKLLAKAEHFIHTRGVKLVVFDYLTLIKTGVAMRSSFDRVGNIGDITNELKELGVRNNVAVLGAAQLSRQNEKEFRTPRMSDLRDSGEIEQAVDTLIFPYDPDAKYHSAQPDTVKDYIWLDLFCAKQREGERNWAIPVEYNKNLQTFSSEEMLGRSKPPVQVAAAQAAAAPARSWQDTDADEEEDETVDRSLLPDFR